ncbi:7TM diverse intracellular signaling domain-containing protein [Chitinophaga ginsengisoli]|uniref:Transposase-like zinc ribbon protein n=1 Tax=Chitinophaga ginsengisoli TaxID=363837 RepID=A0A2P8FRY7_9BACT|nr:7TM diverse intracellular signaling domain-containing protein [Chitinophaga ginsengisoli]PSL24476.1 transposase-like zinc ribbon protein [Chitinophaga ginsengisoli]
MKYFNRGKRLAILSLLLLTAMLKGASTYAQEAVQIDSTLREHIFTYGEIECLEDLKGTLTFDQVRSDSIAARFRSSPVSTPQNQHLGAPVWFRIKVRHDRSAHRFYLLEFFDQTIDEIDAYLPDTNGVYKKQQIGDKYPFAQRWFHHKNFELSLDNDREDEAVYYFRISSAQTADVIIVLRSIDRFVSYALSEYLTFGIFYGMIFIFSFYNLIMFIAMRQRQYLYYVLYNLSVVLYEMCTDGIAYQWLWPNAPNWNQYAFAWPLLSMSIFALLFTRSLLAVHVRAPLLNKLIMGVIVARCGYFLACLLINPYWFNYKFVELIPLAVAFYTGLYIWLRGYRPARFFVLGYSFLFVGFMLKFFIMLGYTWLNFGIVSYYSLSFCFILEMFFLSFAVGDKVRLLKKKRDKAHRQMIRQMTENARLKDSQNRELEAQVQARTKQLSEQADVIAAQNEVLIKTNSLLEAQAAEISRMNALLEQDNRQLQTNVEKVTRARALSTSLDFEEFSKIYPDKESCLHFLADLKWTGTFRCRKCGNEHYYPGHQPFSRRCSKCSYEESATAYTIYQNIRIPINKAFYLTFLVYSTKGRISSHKLSEILEIRQSTCWSYATRITKMMEERKKELKQANGQGWSLLVLDEREDT